jgi:uncharacterized repeat protein (TIGR01451 family)
MPSPIETTHRRARPVRRPLTRGSAEANPAPAGEPARRMIAAASAKRRSGATWLPAFFAIAIALAATCGRADATATPTGLGVQVDYNSASLLWTAVSGASYNVYRGTSSGGETLLAAVSAITSSSTYPVYHDLTAVNGTTYYYEVTAVISSIESGKSTEVTAPLLNFDGFTTIPLQIVASSAIGAYSADAGYVSSTPALYAAGQTVNTTSAMNNAESTTPSTFYSAQRYNSAFYYTLTGLAASTAYIIRLHESETYDGGSGGACTNNNCTGQRIFNVTINGVAVLSNFDIWSQQGGNDIAIGRVFSATSNGSGIIYIAFCSTASLTTPTICTQPATGANNAQNTAIQVYGPGTYPAITPTMTASTLTPAPGTTVTYTSSFSNTGTGPSSNVVITMPIPSPLCFAYTSAAQSLGSTGLTATVSYSHNGGTSYSTTAPANGACGAWASTGYDTTVTNVRWTFSGTLAANNAGGSASVSVSARVP